MEDKKIAKKMELLLLQRNVIPGHSFLFVINGVGENLAVGVLGLLPVESNESCGDDDEAQVSRRRRHTALDRLEALGVI